MKNVILFILLVSPAALFSQAPACTNIEISNDTVSCDTPCFGASGIYFIEIEVEQNDKAIHKLII